MSTWSIWVSFVIFQLVMLYVQVVQYRVNARMQHQLDALMMYQDRLASRITAMSIYEELEKARVRQ